MILAGPAPYSYASPARLNAGHRIGPVSKSDLVTFLSILANSQIDLTASSNHIGARGEM